MNNVGLRKYYTPWFIIPAIFLYALFFLLPNVLNLIVGFTDWSTYNFKDPRFNGLYNFTQIFTDPIFYTAVKNTLYFTFVTTIGKVIIGLFLAVILNRELKLKNMYRLIIFSPIMLSTIVVSLIFSAIYHPDNGIINVFFRVVGLGFLAKQWLIDPQYAMNCVCAMEIWTGIGFVMVIFLAGLQAVPKDIYESSNIDGTNEIQKLLYITIPLIFPTVTINTVFSLIGGMNVFGQVYGLTNGGPLNSTQVYGTFVFKSFANGLFGFSSAAGLIFTLVVSFASFLLLRFFRKFEVEY